MPLKKSHPKTMQPRMAVPGQPEPGITDQDPQKGIDPDNLKVELNQQNEAFKKILARLSMKHKL